MHLAIGIDIGGSHISCGAIDKFGSYLLQSFSNYNIKIHVALAEVERRLLLLEVPAWLMIISL